MNELRTIDPFALDPFDDAFRSLMRPWRMEIPQAAPRIKIDLTEQEGSYVVKAEIPGVKKEDIDVRVDGNTVTISAELKSEKEEKVNGDRVLRRERIRVPAGTFDAIVLQPIIKTSGIFSEGGQAEIWLSDDNRRMMLQMRSRLSFGSLNLYLRNYRASEGAEVVGER